MKNPFYFVVHECINWRNRTRLKNFSPTIVSSNCTGGFIYHWLKLRFNSPFINLWLDSEGFVRLLENWDKVDLDDIKEVIPSPKPYPVAVVGGGKCVFYALPNIRSC